MIRVEMAYSMQGNVYPPDELIRGDVLRDARSKMCDRVFFITKGVLRTGCVYGPHRDGAHMWHMERPCLWARSYNIRISTCRTRFASPQVVQHHIHIPMPLLSFHIPMPLLSFHIPMSLLSYHMPLLLYQIGSYQIGTSIFHSETDVPGVVNFQRRLEDSIDITGRHPCLGCNATALVLGEGMVHGPCLMGHVSWGMGVLCGL